MNRVILFGAYGFGNLGDDLLATYYRDLLRQAFPLSSRGYLAVQALDPPEHPGERFYPRRQTLGLLARTGPGDLWVGGGGSLLQNVSSRRSLAAYLTLMTAARRRGAGVALLGQGYGPVRGAFWRRLTRSVLSELLYAEARDDETWDSMVALGVNRARLERVADPGWTIPVPPTIWLGNDLLLILRRRDNASTWAGTLGTLSAGNLRMKVAALAVEDEPALRRIWGERFDRVLRTPADFWSALDGVGLVASSRLHGLILAASAGIPVVGLGPDPKIGAICRALDSLWWPDLERVDSGKWAAVIESPPVLRKDRVETLRGQALHGRETTLNALARMEDGI